MKTHETLWVLDKPDQPYKTFHDFSERHRLRGTPRWPCFNCRGYGKVYHREDLDPVEGYKMATRHPCPTCKGTGKSTRAEYLFAYQTAMTDYRLQLTKWQKLFRVAKRAWKSLTREEREALHKIGTPQLMRRTARRKRP